MTAAACGKSDAENFADDYCGEVAKCCDQMGSEGEGRFCKMAFTSGGFNASVGEACLADMRKQVTAGTFCTAGASASACQDLISSPTGNRKPGESCDFDDDCAPSSEGKVACASRYDGTDWVHQCQLRLRGTAGSTPCIGTQDGDMFSSMGSSTSDLPSRGYVCDTADGLECSADQCVALAAVGQSCNYASDCVRSAFCDDSYHCASRVAPGGPCTGAADDECTLDHYCPTASPRQCTAKVPTGSGCSYDDMCTSSDCNGTTCEPSVLEQMGWGLLCM